MWWRYCHEKLYVRFFVLAKTLNAQSNMALSKGLAHAKIIKKSVILFRVLNMTI